VSDKKTIGAYRRESPERRTKERHNMSKNKLPEAYVRLKPYALLVEDICKDIDLRGFGFDPGVSFCSKDAYYSLDLPEWFLKRLFDYVSIENNSYIMAFCPSHMLSYNPAIGCPKCNKRS
jgi:hypothetical protein